ncbi:MAG: putative quinol monooxygenase [Pirellulales bacterium]
MIHVVATIETVPGGRDKLLEIFQSLVATVRAEEGCVEYGPAVDAETDLATAEERPNVVTVMEKWSGVDALRAHLAAPHMATFRETVKDLVTRVEIRILDPVGA